MFGFLYKMPFLFRSAITIYLLINIFVLQAEASEISTLEKDPKVVLALGGGGTRGAAHIGVLRVLEKEGIKVDYVVGTSIGALVGGLYCAGVSADEIEQIFYHKKLANAFDIVPIKVRILIAPFFLFARLFGYSPYDGLYHGNRFAHYLTGLAPQNNRLIEHYKPCFWAIATNLMDGQAYAIKKGYIGRAIQASSAIPQLRKPVEIDGALLADGGLVENLPIEHALQMGGDYIIAVDVDPKLAPLPLKHFRGLGSVARRALDIYLAKIDEYQQKMASADIIIQPDVYGINLLSFKTSDAKKAVQAGELAAQGAIPKIKHDLNEMRKKPETRALLNTQLHE